MSLVDSCPSTLTRSNERLTVTPSSRSHVSGDSRASVCTNTSSVAKPGEIIPAPFACALKRTVPPSSARSRHPLRVRVGRADRFGEVLAAVGAERAAGGEDPLGDRAPSAAARRSPRWSDRDALSAPTRAATAAAPCICAASSSPRRPVAAFALPELTTTARRPSRLQRSIVSSTGAASVPDRVKRAALVVCGASDTSNPRSGAPLLDPACDAGGAKALRQAAAGDFGGVRAAPRSTASAKKRSLTRCPPTRAGRTSR